MVNRLGPSVDTESTAMWEFLSSWPALAGAFAVLIVTEVMVRLRERREAKDKEEKLKDEHEMRLDELRSTNRELKARLHEQTTYLLSFSEAVRSLVGAVGVRQVAKGSVRSAGALLQAPNAALLLVDSSGELRLVEGSGFAPSMRGRYVFPVNDEERALDDLVGGGIVTTIRDHPRVRRALRPMGGQWTHAATITSGDDLLGLMLVSNPVGDFHMIQQTMALVSDLTAVALEGASEVDSIRRKQKGTTKRRRRRGAKRNAKQIKPVMGKRVSEDPDEPMQLTLS